MKLSALLTWFAVLGLAWGVAAPDDLVRQGNAAYARGRFADALDLYTRAEERTTDPGLIAFIKDAAL
jgi:hypothetical protein